MHGDGALEILAAELVEGRARERSAREDDVVDAASRRRGRDRGTKSLDDALDGVAMREVGADEGRGLVAGARPRERHRQRLELVGVAGGQDDLVAAVGQGLSDGDSEASSRADDQDSAALASSRGHVPRIAETACFAGREEGARKAGVAGVDRV